MAGESCWNFSRAANVLRPCGCLSCLLAPKGLSLCTEILGTSPGCCQLVHQPFMCMRSHSFHLHLVRFLIQSVQQPDVHIAIMPSRRISTLVISVQLLLGHPWIEQDIHSLLASDMYNNSNIYTICQSSLDSSLRRLRRYHISVKSTIINREVETKSWILTEVSRSKDMRRTSTLRISASAFAFSWFSHAWILASSRLNLHITS